MIRFNAPVPLAPFPARISRLQELAYNIWWSWHPEAQELYQSIDPSLWERTNHNPVRFLREVYLGQLEAAASNPTYLARYDRVMIAFDRYMNATDTWFRRNHPDKADQVIAYFSAEFGLHEALPIYSGGLGILSGDHCKEASDLGLPFVGVGFLYPQGYFRQYITPEGVQEAVYDRLNFPDLPAVPGVGPDGREVLVGVELPGRTVYAKVWRIQVGRIPLFLLDTDVEQNAPQDRELSARLYGGDQRIRISQEMMLGIGGVRALRAIGVHPSVWHMNEGHSAFLGLERLREFVVQGRPFDKAVEEVRNSTVFTTHTPVAAGHDAFPFHMMDEFFAGFWPQLNIDRDTFLSLGRHDQPWGPTFSMTVLALRLSGQYNGVSKLHSQVSREMWHWLWPDRPVDKVPIIAVTNGVHTDTWLAPQLADLYSTVLRPDWRQHIDDPATWEPIANIPDEALWSVHMELKRKLAAFIRERDWQRRRRLGPLAEHDIDPQVNPKALVIGFARRFATYKRATLIFRDMERLKRLLNQPDCPVELLFAGKAHPADEPGKDFIRQVYLLSKDPALRDRIYFIEEYDINVARHLVQGVDVWLNNPRRPYEASGTSGQKAGLNGALNVSILDGWWPEAYNGKNGWAIGDDRSYASQEEQDAADAESLYSLLENEVIPLYYQRDADGLPHDWISRMKNSIMTIAPNFSFARMLKEYVEWLYIPAMGVELAKED
ncbi:MAG: alpha-1,4 glucan phosphorylase [Herpetosiphonaceae bacterium]|nr:MAG: alpha-1,4 glucan phosphorylase [Herpetosiphonaceae bacterium]